MRSEVTGDVARLVECSPNTHRSLGLIPGTASSVRVAHACNFGTQEWKQKDQKFKVGGDVCL